MGFKAIISGIFALVGLIKDLLGLFSKMQKDKGKQAINDSHKAVKELKNAKTPEEKKLAAQRLADLIGDM